MALINLFIPRIIEKTVFDIDYEKLYQEGKRVILTDLDNTLIPYDLDIANDEVRNLFNKWQTIGFKTYIISNNHKERIERFANDLNVGCIYMAKKPLKIGFKKAFKKFGLTNRNEIITIGDQIMTDVLGSNRLKMDCILVRPIKKKTEKWYTRLNRVWEGLAIKRMKKTNIDKYEEIIAKHEY